MKHTLIRKALLADLDDIKLLADAHKQELGFVLRSALARSIERSELLIAENSKGAIGFLEYHHRRDQQTTIYHIAVDQKYRRKGVGHSLLKKLVNESLFQNKRFIKLKCPEGLEAQLFYTQVGFSIVGQEEGKKRRLNVWGLLLVPA